MIIFFLRINESSNISDQQKVLLSQEKIIASTSLLIKIVKKFDKMFMFKTNMEINVSYLKAMIIFLALILYYFLKGVLRKKVQDEINFFDIFEKTLSQRVASKTGKKNILNKYIKN